VPVPVPMPVRKRSLNLRMKRKKKNSPVKLKPSFPRDVPGTSFRNILDHDPN
jgi:hypothetical protein